MIRLVAPLTIVLLAGCGGQPKTGPVDPAWDRDACEHCRMVVSDRSFATQIRSAADGQVRHFDDPGCAVLFGTQPDDEIWVRSLDGAGWLDARTTAFVTGQRTPMGYGFGADPGAEEGVVWSELARQVRERDRERRHDAGS